MLVFCTYCKAPINKKPSWVHTNNFCSRWCFNEYKKTPEMQFWRYVLKPQLELRSIDCWLWTGCKDRNGYGRAGNNVEAHRMSYILNIGPIAAGELVRHSCHNPPCVSPYHLSTGSTHDNSRDMVEAGRSLRGSKHGLAILSDADVQDVMRRYINGEKGVSIARHYGVYVGTIRKILTGRGWTHIPIPKR